MFTSKMRSILKDSLSQCSRDTGNEEEKSNRYNYHAQGNLGIKWNRAFNLIQSATNGFSSAFIETQAQSEPETQEIRQIYGK
jgi:hypothetical protein